MMVSLEIQSTVPRLRTPTLCAALLLMMSAAWPPAPIDAQEPRFQLDTHGPVGRLHALRFVPGTHRLLGGGADKQAYEWILHTPNENGPFRFVRSHVLRWTAARGPNGVVHALDVSPDGDSVALAGRSAYGQGHIWVFDRSTRTLQEVIKAHASKVLTLRFSPDGQHLASVDQVGQLRLWSMPPRAQPRPLDEAGEHIPEATHEGGVADDLQPLAFLPDGLILTAKQAGTNAIGQSVVKLSVPALMETQVLPVAAGQIITALAVEPATGRWACALGDGRPARDQDGVIVLNDGVGQLQRFRAGQPRIFSLQFGPQQTLLAATDQDPTGQSWLELWNAAAGQQLGAVQLGASDDAYSCAVSDDGQLAAVYANGPRELWVLPLLNDQGQLLQNPLAQRSALRLFSGQDVDDIRFLNSERLRLKIDVAGDVAGWEFDEEFGGIKRTPPDEDPAPPPPPPQDEVPRRSPPRARPSGRRQSSVTQNPQKVLRRALGDRP